MSWLQIDGGNPLRGEVHISGSKNESLPVLCASLLTTRTVLHRVPDLSDTRAALEILQETGSQVQSDQSVVIIPGEQIRGMISDELMGRMRSSILFLTPLLYRCKCVTFTQPGGCALGSRPIDLHLRALEQMGASFTYSGGKITGTCDGFKGAVIRLPYPSVGATETVLMAAAVADSPTVLHGRAREPEIRGLMNFLRLAGCGFSEGRGGNLVITPAKSLRSVEYTIGPDRMETVTWMCAAQATGGTLWLMDTAPEMVARETEILRKMGAFIRHGARGLVIRGGCSRRALVVSTGPWPALPTDSGPMLAAASIGMKGNFEICETVFTQRFSYRDGLRAFGVPYSMRGSCLHLETEGALRPSAVCGHDLRGTAALVIAALAAPGRSFVGGIEHLRRGYEKTEQKLGRLGVACKEIYES